MAKVEKQREAEAFLDLNEHAAEPFWEEETVQEVSAALSFELNDAAALASVQAEVQAKEAKRAAAAEARRALEKARREADKKEAADQEEALQAAEGLRLLQEEASAPRIASMRLPSDDVAHKTKSTFTSRTTKAHDIDSQIAAETAAALQKKSKSAQRQQCQTISACNEYRLQKSKMRLVRQSVSCP